MRTKLKEGEKVEITIRKRWIIYTNPAIAFLFSSVCYLWVAQNDSMGQFKNIAETVCKYAAAASFLYFAYMYLERKTNIWVVTNYRMIDEWGIVTHRAKESVLNKINNVDVVRSIAGRMLGFGNMLVQTAATYGDTWIKNVENPFELKETLLKCVEQYSPLKDHPENNRALEKHKDVAEESGITNQADTRACPYCAETIKAKAKICRYCNRELLTVDNTANTAITTQTESDKNVPVVTDKASPFDWKKAAL